MGVWVAMACNGVMGHGDAESHLDEGNGRLGLASWLLWGWPVKVFSPHATHEQPGDKHKGVASCRAGGGGGLSRGRPCLPRATYQRPARLTGLRHAHKVITTMK